MAKSNRVFRFLQRAKKFIFRKKDKEEDKLISSKGVCNTRSSEIEERRFIYDPWLAYAGVRMRYQAEGLKAIALFDNWHWT